MIASNNTPNYQVIAESIKGVLFKNKRDRKILNVDPHVSWCLIFVMMLEVCGINVASLWKFSLRLGTTRRGMRLPTVRMFS